MKKLFTLFLISCTLYFGYYYFTHRSEIQGGLKPNNVANTPEISTTTTEHDLALQAIDGLEKNISSLEIELNKEEKNSEFILEKINHQKNRIDTLSNERKRIEIIEKNKLERIQSLKKQQRDEQIVETKKKIQELNKQLKHLANVYQQAHIRLEEHKAFYEGNAVNLYFANVEKQREFEKEKKSAELRILKNISDTRKRGNELREELTLNQSKLESLRQTQIPLMPDMTDFDKKLAIHVDIIRCNDEEKKLLSSIGELEKSRELSKMKILALSSKIENIFPSNKK